MSTCENTLLPSNSNFHRSLLPFTFDSGTTLILYYLDLLRLSYYLFSVLYWHTSSSPNLLIAHHCPFHLTVFYVFFPFKSFPVICLLPFRTFSRTFHKVLHSQLLKLPGFLSLTLYSILQPPACHTHPNHLPNIYSFACTTPNPQIIHSPISFHTCMLCSLHFSFHPPCMHPIPPLMASNVQDREFGWTESSESDQSLEEYDGDLDMAESFDDDLDLHSLLARHGLVLQAIAENLDNQREYWQMCAIAFLLDY